MRKMVGLVLAVMLALSAVSALAAEYSDKDTVKKVQQALNDAGYDCGTPDGTAGKKTKAAITSYQTDKGLTVSGVIDDELLVALGLAEAETAETSDEESREEFTFQGIPWGSSYEYVDKILVESGFLGSPAGFNDTFGIAVWPEVLPGDSSMFYNDKTGIGGMGMRNEVLKTVGGYEVGSINLHYLYEVQNNETVPNTHLTMVELRLNGVDNDDLIDKLNQKYGKYQDSIQTYIYFWYGDNNTAIAYWCAAEALYYAKTDDYKTAEALLAVKPVIKDAGL